MCSSWGNIEAKYLCVFVLKFRSYLRNLYSLRRGKLSLSHGIAVTSQATSAGILPWECPEGLQLTQLTFLKSHNRKEAGKPGKIVPAHQDQPQRRCICELSICFSMMRTHWSLSQQLLICLNLVES